MAAYDFVLLFIGLAILGAIVLPRLLADKPLSFPLIYVLVGMGLFALPLGIELPDPVKHAQLSERLTELVVIIAIVGAGLKIDRPIGVEAWSTTWRLLLITMPITIICTALLGWWLLGTLAATAILLGAVVAPTDPVLASDVQVTPPTEQLDEDTDPVEAEGSVRFALTSEAGLNDGLAFPFTNLAIAAAGATLAEGASLAWLVDWALVDILYKILVGILMGYVAGYVLARFIFGRPQTSDLARIMSGAEALATTLIAYAATELVGAYGFIAVFVAALELRQYEWDHDYYVDLHDFAVTTERLLMAAVLVLFGGAIASGLFAPLTWLDVLVGIAVVVVVRPVAGLIGLAGTSLSWDERLVVSTYGIRGIGSFFYLAHALNEASFQEAELLLAAEKLWAIVGFVALFSIVVHGATANYVMAVVDRRRSEPAPGPAAGAGHD